MCSPFDPKRQANNIDSKILASLERIGEAFRVMLTSQNKTHKLSNIQIQIMIYLLYHPEKFRTLTNISKDFNITKASLSDSIKSLESKKYIIKAKSPDDSRVSKIFLTESGKNIAKKLSVFGNNVEVIISKLPEENKKVVLDSLLSIIHGLFIDGIISMERMCLNCIYFLPSQNNQDNFCKLLNKPLSNHELRVDCIESDF